MGYRNQKCDCIWFYFKWACRLWGIATAIVLLGVGVEAVYREYLIGIYMIIASLLMFLLESVFAIDFCVKIHISDNLCLCLWKGVLWLDNWKKGLLYICLSVGCFILAISLWLAIISGVMMVISGLLYMIKTFKTRQDEQQERKSSRKTYDRFDEVQDDIDDNLPEAFNSNVHEDDNMETMAEQDEILDV